MNDKMLQIAKHSASLRAAVEDRIRQAIISGVFRPGDRLVEKKLCELIGVGRTSIREAMRQLEAEGLIVNFPHRGPVVATITYEEAEQIYQVRALLEGLLGKDFAGKGTPEEIARLEDSVLAFEAAVEVDDRSALIDAKTHFYQCLMDGGRNAVARQMLTLIHNRITMLRFTSMTQPGRIRHSIKEIRDILGAIKERNGARAAAACRYHVEMAAITALEYLRKTPENV